MLTKKRSVNKFINLYTKKNYWSEHEINENNLGYGWIHYGLIRQLQPNRVLVMGSRYGFVPAVCALACKENNKGVVDFVDAGFDITSPQDVNRHWGGMGFWKKNDVTKHFAKFKLNKQIKFYLLTSQAFKKKYPHRKWDYVYLDGDHSYHGVKQDFNNFWPQLKSGGYLGLHDINIKKQGGFNYGVIRLWQELNKKGLNCLSFPGKYGLGLVKK